MNKSNISPARSLPFYFCVLAAAFLLIPMLSILLLASPSEGSNLPSSVLKPEKLPKSISVYITETKKIQRINFEDYVTCVVCSEVPNTFHPEAIKAQAVAARTYALAKIKKYDKKHPAAHPTAPICDSTHCQVYRSQRQLVQLHPKGWERDGYQIIEKAVKQTKGQVMYYDGSLVMQPLFFSSSGGYTENSEDVFVSAYPYLKSVASPYEENATHRNDKKSFSVARLKSLLKEFFPQRDFSKVSLKNIKILSRTAGGRVALIRLGDQELTGSQVRSALDLGSALFSIEERNGKIIFSSSGSGHGVGMSQYGANGMAKKGYHYQDILKHYYSGVEIY